MIKSIARWILRDEISTLNLDISYYRDARMREFDIATGFAIQRNEAVKEAEFWKNIVKRDRQVNVRAYIQSEDYIRNHCGSS